MLNATVDEHWQGSIRLARGARDGCAERAGRGGGGPAAAEQLAGQGARRLVGKAVEDVFVFEEPLILRTRTTYKGPLLVGRDMMSFRIGDTVEAFSPDGARLEP